VDFAKAKLNRISQLDIAACRAVVECERLSLSVIKKNVCLYKIHLKAKISVTWLQNCITIFLNQIQLPLKMERNWIKNTRIIVQEHAI
jgi:hypothetical protein